jgi:hypothetical protein
VVEVAALALDLLVRALEQLHCLAAARAALRAPRDPMLRLPERTLSPARVARIVDRAPRQR